MKTAASGGSTGAPSVAVTTGAAVAGGGQGDVRYNDFPLQVKFRAPFADPTAKLCDGGGCDMTHPAQSIIAKPGFKYILVNWTAKNLQTDRPAKISIGDDPSKPEGIVPRLLIPKADDALLTADGAEHEGFCNSSLTTPEDLKAYPTYCEEGMQNTPHSWPDLAPGGEVTNNDFLHYPVPESLLPKLHLDQWTITFRGDGDSIGPYQFPLKLNS